MPFLIVKTTTMENCFTVACLAFVFICHVSGHGRMLDPPQRSSIWRVAEFAKFRAPINYNDNELFCGGFSVQHGQNGGKCGACGDAYHLPQPRANEGGGQYGKGIIVRNYHRGQTVTVDIELTASHKGHFEFRLCNWNQPTVPDRLSCFQKNLLKFSDGTTKFNIHNGGPGHYYPKVVLPNDINCSQCVLQWTYTAGNNWGWCGNGTGALGCGPQETFVNCADISIN